MIKIFQLAFINKGLLLHWLLAPSSFPSLLPSLDSALSFDRVVSGAQQLEAFSLLEQNLAPIVNITLWQDPIQDSNKSNI